MTTPGWKASQDVRARKARLREMGMFHDISKFVLDWRLNGGTGKYPSDATLRNYLHEQGWRAERGGKVSIRTVQEMIRFMDPDLDALPSAGEERVARSLGEFLPGTETMFLKYSPADWMEYREAVLRGWKPKHLVAGDPDKPVSG